MGTIGAFTVFRFYFKPLYGVLYPIIEVGENIHGMNPEKGRPIGRNCGWP
jgi:hypothetical protein